MHTEACRRRMEAELAGARKAVRAKKESRGVPGQEASGGEGSDEEENGRQADGIESGGGRGRQDGGVLWKRKRKGGPLGKLTCMWEGGIYLGMKGTTGELIVGTKEGIWRTRTVRRKPFEERWRRENLELVGGVPWRMMRNEGGESEELKNDVVIMDKDYQERLRNEEVEAVPRNMYISKEDCETFGYTEKCPGCVSILKGNGEADAYGGV
jgi:hypothetical protein